MSHSVYLADLLNNHVLRNTTYNPPPNTYISLFLSSNGLDDNAEGSQDEVVGGSYARLIIDGSTRSFTASAGKTSSNNEDWEFTKATADWGMVTHIAIMDAATSGNVLYYGVLNIARDIQTNDIFRFLAGEFDSIYT